MRNQSMNTRQRTALWLSVFMIVASILACTSNDTLFIKLTPTPLPTPTLPTIDTGTRFAKGNRVYAIGLGRGLNVDLYEGPGSEQVNYLAVCARNSPVTIAEIARNTENQDDPLLYYQISCAGKVGWLPEYSLSALNPKNGKAVVKSEDGKGAIIYKRADPTSDEAGNCEEGVTVSVNDVVPVIDEVDPAATTQFARVTCNKVRGYILETLLVPGEA